jgi:predicted nucleic acid-binding protein
LTEGEEGCGPLRDGTGSREDEVRSVVLDTNVLIGAAFRPQSHSGQVVELVRKGRLRLVWDGPTRGESASLLRRIPPISWEDFESLFDAKDRFDEPVDPSGFESVPDLEDRKFAALAEAAGATLVTLDAHLLEAGLGKRMRVVTPRTFLSDVGSA